MRFSFHTFMISPHQLPLAREIVSAGKSIPDFEFIYVPEFDMDDERRALGWHDQNYPWVLSPLSKSSAHEICKESDFLFSYLRTFEIFKARVAKGTVYCSERWFKPSVGIARLLLPSYWRMARCMTTLLSKNVGFFYFPIGIHAARDMARLCGLMHGDLRCLFRAPKLDFERRPGGRIYLSSSTLQLQTPTPTKSKKYCLDKMRMWGYFVEEGRGKKEEGRRDVYRQRAQEKIDEWLDGVSEHWFVDVLDKLLEDKLATGEYKFKGSGGRAAMREGAIRFFRQFSRKIVQLSDGRCVYFTPDERAKKRNADKAVSWAEYAIHAVTSSGKMIKGKEYRERLYNLHKASVLQILEQVIAKECCMYRLIDAHPENDAVLFIGRADDGARLEVVTRLDLFGNVDANLAEVTVVAMHKSKQENEKHPPPKRYRPLTEVVEAVAKHQAAGFSPSTTETSIAYYDGTCNSVSSPTPPLQTTTKTSTLQRQLFSTAKLTPNSQLTTNDCPPTTIKVLWVGRLLKLKRVDTIIRAVGELSSNKVVVDSCSCRKELATSNLELKTTTRTNPKITLDIYGAGTEEMRLKKFAAKYGGAIKFYPPVPIDEVRKLMQEHDVYVFGSNGYEGWGAVVSEALEEGMKVIGTYEAGASATILPKERLFHAGDWRTLKRLLEQESKGQLPPCSIGEWTAKKAAELLVVSG